MTVVTVMTVMTVVTIVTKQLCTPQNFTYLKPTYLLTYVPVVTVGTVGTVVTVVRKITQPLYKKITQPRFFWLKNHVLHSRQDDLLQCQLGLSKWDCVYRKECPEYVRMSYWQYFS